MSGAFVLTMQFHPDGQEFDFVAWERDYYGTGEMNFWEHVEATLGDRDFTAIVKLPENYYGEVKRMPWQWAQTAGLISLDRHADPVTLEEFQQMLPTLTVASIHDFARRKPRRDFQTNTVGGAAVFERDRNGN